MTKNPPSALIKLSISAGKTVVTGYDDFCVKFGNRLNVDRDYINRLLAGTRILNQNHISAINAILGFDIDFSMTERELAATLNLSRKTASKYINDMSSGLDLTARTSDRSTIMRIQNLIGGYWESIYWSVSNLKQQAVSRDLCIIGEINDDNYIECRIIDGHFEYSGVIFPVVQHLYFILEKEKFFNEVIFYMTNLPDRTPPILRGIIGCLSGGVNDSRSYPSASKVAFRYLGKSGEEVRNIYPDAPDGGQALQQYLEGVVPSYITREDITSGTLSETAMIEIDAIDNTLDSTAVPFALRSTN